MNAQIEVSSVYKSLNWYVKQYLTAHKISETGPVLQ